MEISVCSLFQMSFFSGHVCYPIPVPKVYQLEKHSSGKNMCTRLGLQKVKKKKRDQLSGQGKVREKWKNFKVREKSGNFGFSQGNLKF